MLCIAFGSDGRSRPATAAQGYGDVSRQRGPIRVAVLAPQRAAQNPHIGPAIHRHRTAAQHADGGDAVDRAFHRKVELPLPPHVDGRVPAFGKALRARAFAQVIGRLPAHPHRLRRLSHRAHDMQRQDKPFLLRRRPPIRTPPVERNRGEGEQTLVGEERGGRRWGG